MSGHEQRRRPTMRRSPLGSGEPRSGLPTGELTGCRALATLTKKWRKRSGDGRQTRQRASAPAEGRRRSRLGGPSLEHPLSG